MRRGAIPLSEPQIMALIAAYRAADGWIMRGARHGEIFTPRTVIALERLRLMKIESKGDLRTRRARLTDRGQRLAKRLMGAHVA